MTIRGEPFGNGGSDTGAGAGYKSDHHASSCPWKRVALAVNRFISRP